MGKKHKNLFPQIIDMDNMWRAYHKAAKGRRYSTEHLRFQQHGATNLRNLSRSIENGTYRPGQPRHFMVREPKPREISAMPFVDRVAEHALCNIIEPIFDRVFLPQSFACRQGKGTHSAAKHVQANLRRMDSPYVLKTDFSKYFASIDRPTLHREFARKIACPPTLRLLHTMLPAHYPGLDIGRLISQLSANVYGHILDRWLTHTMGVTTWTRYMDDLVVLSTSREALATLRHDIQHFAWQVMGLKFSHWSIQSARRGVNFVGYRIWHTHKLLRKDSVTRAKRKLKRLHGVDRDKFLAAWIGHAQHADSHNLLKHLEVA